MAKRPADPTCPVDHHTVASVLARYGELPDTLRADPFPLYEGLRRSGTVHAATLPDGRPVAVVTGYRAARTVFTDPRFSNDPGHRADLPRFDGDRHMGVADGDAHRRLRTVVARHFTADRVRAARPWITGVTDELLDGLSAEADLIGEFAGILPLRVILTLLGAPPARIPPMVAALQRLSDAPGDPAAAETVRTGVTDAIRHRERNPGDDVLTDLIAARDTGDIDDGELTATVFLLLSAGHETTVNLIAVGALHLLRHPDQWARLRERPSSTPGAVDELLRYDGPAAHSTGRYTTTDVVLDGVAIPAGRLVLVNLTAANRDPEATSDADRLDVTRSPTRHLAFGHGRHLCLGAHLARLEAEIALSRLSTGFTDIRLAVDPAELAWKASPAIRGLTSLPVRLTR
ncbi:cytochrome P450 [Stackebrandtia albiflava]|uniref:Cytochrome P450 n=1 Tax=Stackebrandtia albiflava TaxID=406432 RepID=A0A562UL74_9ACTN|nr:cytochrome P450 [Stackebrandtia albiflava]TWJ06365.1 cytochrome P450 [Stackebrandtia albiflava]